MKPFALLSLYLAGAALWAQTAPAQPARRAEPEPDTVVATFDDGGKLTYAELKTFINVLPAQMQQLAMRDRKAFITQFALMRKLAQMAEKNKLYEESPAKEMLQFNRMQVLTNAQINDTINKIAVPPADVQKQYEANKGRYTQVRVKALYISFSPAAAAPGGKKYMTEPEARAKIEQLLKEIRGGADFVKMIKQHSEDQASAAKDGDFGNIRRGDNLPDAVRNAIFALKQGEVSEPVRQPNGFYLFRAEQITEQPLAQVRDEIFNELKQNHFRAWMEETQRSLNVQIDSAVLNQLAPATPMGPVPTAPAKK